MRSARTTGLDGSPEVRSTAVGVSTATIGTLRLARREDELDGGPDRVAQLAVDARAEQGIDDDRRPFDVLARGRVRSSALDGVDARHPRLAIEPVPVPAPRPAVDGLRRRRDEHDRHLGAGPREVARRDEPVAAVVAGPAQDQDRALLSTGPSPRRSPSRPPRPPRRRAPSAAGPGTPSFCAFRSAPVIASDPIGARAAAPAQRRRSPRRSRSKSSGSSAGRRAVGSAAADVAVVVTREA